MNQINSSQITTLLGSLPGLSTPAAGKNSALTDVTVKSAPSKTVTNKDTLTSISSSAKSLNSLYSDIKKTGNEASVSGFKKSIVSMASGLDASGLNNFVKMGEKAFKEKDSSFFTGMLETYNDLTKNKKSLIADSFLKEAGETFALGIGSSKSFSNSAKQILQSEQTNGNTTITGAEALGEFVSAWKDIRSQDISKEEKTAKIEELAKNITSKTNTIDIADYVRQLRLQAKLTPKIIHG